MGIFETTVGSTVEGAAQYDRDQERWAELIKWNEGGPGGKAKPRCPECRHQIEHWKSVDKGHDTEIGVFRAAHSSDLEVAEANAAAHGFVLPHDHKKSIGDLPKMMAAGGVAEVIDEGGRVAQEIGKVAGEGIKEAAKSTTDALPWYTWAGIGLGVCVGLGIVVKVATMEVPLPRSRRYG